MGGGNDVCLDIASDAFEGLTQLDNLGILTATRAVHLRHGATSA